MYTILILLFGIALGVYAKLLDSISIDDTISWQYLLGKIDLNNVFSRLSVWALIAICIAIYSNRPTRAAINVFTFFVGMLIGYYFYTIKISGFYPKSYIIAWSTITFFTPILAFFTWYSKGTGWFSAFLSAIIIGFFITQAVSYGMWYFYIKYIAELVCLLLVAFILLKKRKQSLFSLIGAFCVAPIIQMLLPYVLGGL